MQAPFDCTTDRGLCLEDYCSDEYCVEILQVHLNPDVSTGLNEESSV